MKKKAFIFLVSILMTITSVGLTASAHHGKNRNTTRSSTNYATCSVENCNITYNHKHDGVYYCGHSLNDGHEHHTLCDVQDCTNTGVHMHDGEYYYPHSSNDGHSYSCGRSSNGRKGYCR